MLLSSTRFIAWRALKSRWKNFCLTFAAQIYARETA